MLFNKTMQKLSAKLPKHLRSSPLKRSCSTLRSSNCSRRCYSMHGKMSP